MPFPTPSTMPPGLSDWQFYYNGLTFGAGTGIEVLSWDGFGLAPIRSGDAGRPLDQGELMGYDLFGGVDTTVHLWVASNGTSSLQTLLQQVSTAFLPLTNTLLPLYVQLPDSPLLAKMVRPRKRDISVDVNYGAAQVGTPSVMLHSPDPRWYSTPTQQRQVGVPTPSGGFTFPLTFPLVFGGGSSSGVISADNTGNMEMRPVITITGPCTDPWVENASVASNPRLTFTNPFQTGFTLNAGDTLTVDLDFQSIVYTPYGSTVGTAVPGWLTTTSTWWALQPGTNTIQFGTSDSTAVAGTCAVAYASAYVSAT